MPTPKKVQQVEELKESLRRCSIAVSTGYQGLSAAAMTELRRRLRAEGIEYRVVKNTLVLRAAQEMGRDKVAEVLRGPTGIAFGYGDVVATAKAISSFITTTRLPLTVRGGIMDSRVLTAEEVRSLATLPPREELLARVLGQMQAPIAGLVNTLNGVISGLAIVLQRRVEQMQAEGQ
ncbi:MAG: 50S ribosomal protein L10 [Chloroflexi bacterium]|nr:50S ribosomal protein L10 [Chloroflexota bacterium]